MKVQAACSIENARQGHEASAEDCQDNLEAAVRPPQRGILPSESGAIYYGQYCMRLSDTRTSWELHNRIRQFQVIPSRCTTYLGHLQSNQLAHVNPELKRQVYFLQCLNSKAYNQSPASHSMLWLQQTLIVPRVSKNMSSVSQHNPLTPYSVNDFNASWCMSPPLAISFYSAIAPRRLSRTCKSP